MRIRTLIVTFLAAAPLAAAPAQHPFGLDDVARMKRVSDPEVSPDGGWVAYTVRSVNVQEDKGDTDLWMTSWDGKDSVRLTTSKDSENTPRWSPDGRYLAFLSSRDDDNEVSQVWLLPRAGGEAEKITELKGGVEDLDWSPDSKRLVLVVSDAEAEDADAGADKDKSADKGSRKKKTKKPIVIDRFQFKSDESGYLGKQRSHLVLFDVASRQAAPLTSGEYDEQLPAWSPDGKSIAFVSKHGPDPDRTDVWQVWTIETRAGAAARQLTSETVSSNQPDWDSRLAWSPDSQSIAYIQGGPDKLIYYGLHKLAVIPAAGGPPRVLTSELDRNVQSPRFTADGGSILFTLEEDQAVFLAKIPSAGGKIDRLVSSRGCVSAFSAARGGQVAMLWSTSSKPPEVYAFSGLRPGEPRALTHQNDAWLAELNLAPVEETKFKSKDGTSISGFLVKPVGYVPGRLYPTILRIHGGPVGQFECAFEDEWQWFAANGYVVVAANPRGSSGKGEKFQAAIFADWGHVDAEDVVAAVDDAVARKIADPDRLAVGGWSYGSMLTNYVIASTTRFKAATSGAGSSNALAEYGTDQYIREYEQELGTPWKNLDSYLKVSFPFFHADRITTPTLFLCGDADFNMPLINSEQMYQALRSLGVPTQLVIYPGQHHGIRKPSYVRDRLERYLAWYDKYAKAEKTAERIDKIDKSDKSDKTDKALATAGAPR